jgi:protein TonB
MFGSKINLHRAAWLDVIFDQKNKSYGAYALRRESDANTSKSLLYAGTFFILLFLSPRIISLIKGPAPVEVTTNPVEVMVAPPPAVNPETPPPPAIESPAAKQDQVKFLPPVVLPDPMVRDVEPPQIKELQKADPGQKTVAGSPDAEIVIVETAGEGPNKDAAAVVDDRQVYDIAILEVAPVFPGGMDKFYKYLNSAIKYPLMAAEQNIQGKVFVSFVVEKNGALTDIKVLRSLGSGTDEEAVRVLKASPNWIPGVQNGKQVRVKYNIPISFSLAN